MVPEKKPKMNSSRALSLFRKTVSRVSVQRPSKRGIKADNKVFRISEEVRHAINEGQPVVALETTIYTHGSWPYPDNLQMALNHESVVRSNGAIPATIGVVDGIAYVGMSTGLLERLLVSQNARKLSRRDFGLISGQGLLGNKQHGGTTIAGTMILAHLAGIKVFATGGLGGVHRGAESSMDISADLTELGRTPVAVISSGCKGFLDIARTLEYLETEGAVVATFADGRTGPVDFPAFWSRDSGIRSPAQVQDEKEAAAVIHAQSELSINSGILLANPASLELEIALAEIGPVIEEALQAANQAGVTGSANTPFVLNKICELTQGRSIKSNYGFVENNVIRGCKVAIELSHLEKRSSIFQPRLRAESIHDAELPRSPSMNARKGLYQNTTRNENLDVLVAGSIAIDLSCDYSPPSSTPTSPIAPVIHTSNPATITHSLGGVGHNIAKTLHLLGTPSRLFSAVANDIAGQTVLDALSDSGLDTTGIATLQPGKNSVRTAQYVAINDRDKNLYIAMADMGILEVPMESTADSFLPITTTSVSTAPYHNAKWLVLDANWGLSALSRWRKFAQQANIRIAFEPVSNAKAIRLLDIGSAEDSIRLVDLATPNALELTAMHKHAQERGLFEQERWWQHVDAFGIPSSGARKELSTLTSPELVDEGLPQQSLRLLPIIPIILTKLGSRGVMLTQLLTKDDPRLSSAASAPHILSRTKVDIEGVNVGGVYMRLFPAIEELDTDELVSVNGAGDTFLGALIASLCARERLIPANNTGTTGASMAGSLQPLHVEDVVDLAQRASVLTLRSKEAVNPKIGDELRPLLATMV